MKKGKTWAVRLGFFAVVSLILISTNLWSQTDRGAGVPGEVLPDSLRGLDIKDQFIPSTNKRAGVIHALRGHVVVIHRGTNEAYFGMEGDYLYENDSINTLDNSRCRIKMSNDDIATMAPNTEFSVDAYSDDRKKRKKISVFGMLKGKVRFFALRLLRYKETKVTVNTPTAIVGVRGTDFGIHVYGTEERKLSQGGIMVADSGSDIGTYLASNGPVGGTEVMFFHGCGTANGRAVCRGQKYSSEDGQVGTATDEQMYYFICDTDLEGCIKIETKKGEELWEEWGEDPDFAAYTAGVVTDQMELPAVTPLSGLGYFTALLALEGVESLWDAFVSMSGQPFGGPDMVQAEAIGTFGYGGEEFGYMGALIASGDFTALKQIVTDNPSDGILDTDDGASPPPPYPITIQNNSTLSFAQWGPWNIANKSLGSSISFNPNIWIPEGTGFYVAGDSPNWHDDWYNIMEGAYYCGGAEGLYYDGSHRMTGEFWAWVDFCDRAVYDFNLWIDNGQEPGTTDFRAAEIWYGSGPFEEGTTQFHLEYGDAALYNGSSSYFIYYPWEGRVSVRGALYQDPAICPTTAVPSHMLGVGAIQGFEEIAGPPYYVRSNRNGASLLFHGELDSENGYHEGP